MLITKQALFTIRPQDAPASRLSHPEGRKDLFVKDNQFCRGPLENTDDLVMRYMPFARKIARSYEGRGAEYDDLVQEGFLALHSLISRYAETRPPQPLGLYLWYRLRPCVRNAAERLRRGAAHDSLEQKFEEDGFDVPFQDGSYAVFDLLEGLSPDERELAGGLARGMTQRELADCRAVSQQAVSRRVIRLREKLRRAMIS